MLHEGTYTTYIFIFKRNINCNCIPFFQLINNSLLKINIKDLEKKKYLNYKLHKIEIKLLFEKNAYLRIKYVPGSGFFLVIHRWAGKNVCPTRY